MSRTPHNRTKSKGAKIMRQGHTKTATGSFGTNPNASTNGTSGASVDLKK